MARQSSGKTKDIRESREMDVTGLSEDELIERATRNTRKFAAVSLWLRDSSAWMEAAVFMNDLSRRTAPKGDPIDHNRANVAYVATGYAYELLMKSIAKADDAELKPRHSVKKIFSELGKERKQEIREAMAKHKVQNAEWCLDYVDARMAHKDRKYWMFEKDMWSAGATSFMVADGVLSIGGLARIHREIVAIGRRAFEEWWKIHSREHAAISQELADRPKASSPPGARPVPPKR